VIVSLCWSCSRWWFRVCACSKHSAVILSLGDQLSMLFAWRCSVYRPSLLLISTPSTRTLAVSLSQFSFSRPCIVRVAAASPADTNSAAFTAVQRISVLPVNTEVSSVARQSILSFSRRLDAAAVPHYVAEPFISPPPDSIWRPLILFFVSVSRACTHSEHLNRIEQSTGAVESLIVELAWSQAGFCCFGPPSQYSYFYPF